jgi:ubiquinone/menaquinone biosynthesis C-methylase UbiE
MLFLKSKMKNMYVPETYWDTVAGELQQRPGSKFIAGDVDPFYIYKRKKFLRFFSSISFSSKKVIEIGPGPGGNLLEIYKQQPAHLTGADISGQMLDLCKLHIAGKNIELVKINGKDLCFEPGYFDIAITSTVLQHVTDDAMLSALIKDICRITKSDIYIFERIEKRYKKNNSNAGRTIEAYEDIFKKNNVSLHSTRFLNVYWSRLVCGIIRKIFNSSKRKEGASQTKASVFFQKLVLKITRLFDSWLPVKKDIAMLHFKKNAP